MSLQIISIFTFAATQDSINLVQL